MSSPIISAIKQICEEKNIPMESVIETIEHALAAAYRKDFGEKNQNIKVEFDPQTGEAKVFDVKTVVEEPPPEEEESAEEKSEKGEEEEKNEEKEEEKKKRFNPKTDLILKEAKKIKKGAKIGDIIKTELEVPSDYGRIAAQTAKQVIIQRLREAEREVLYNEFKSKEGKVVSGVIHRREGQNILVDLNRLTAILPAEEQIEYEKYFPGQRFKFFIISVNSSPKGPEIIVSRRHPEILKELFNLEIIEINEGTVVIKAIAREAGLRSKVAVASTQENIDPIGSCIGQKGARIQTIISELGGEKIDIIEYDENPVKFITKALSPAKISSVEINEKEKIALVKVKEDQFSLAIGKGGQNVRLAAKLTGWKINIEPEKIKSVEETAEENPEAETVEKTIEEKEEAPEKNKKKRKKEKAVEPEAQEEIKTE